MCKKDLSGQTGIWKSSATKAPEEKVVTEKKPSTKCLQLMYDRELKEVCDLKAEIKCLRHKIKKRNQLIGGFSYYGSLEELYQQRTLLQEKDPRGEEMGKLMGKLWSTKRRLELNKEIHRRKVSKVKKGWEPPARDPYLDTPGYVCLDSSGSSDGSDSMPGLITIETSSEESDGPASRPGCRSACPHTRREEPVGYEESKHEDVDPDLGKPVDRPDLAHPNRDMRTPPCQFFHASPSSSVVNTFGRVRKLDPKWAELRRRDQKPGRDRGARQSPARGHGRKVPSKPKKCRQKEHARCRAECQKRQVQHEVIHEVYPSVWRSSDGSSIPHSKKAMTRAIAKLRQQGLVADPSAYGELAQGIRQLLKTYRREAEKVGGRRCSQSRYRGGKRRKDRCHVISTVNEAEDQSDRGKRMLYAALGLMQRRYSKKGRQNKIQFQGVVVLVDTGACRSFIDLKRYKRLKRDGVMSHVVWYKEPGRIKAAVGEAQPNILGVVVLYQMLNGGAQQAHAYEIVQDLGVDMIWGRDYLEASGANIDYDSTTLNLKRIRLQSTLEKVDDPEKEVEVKISMEDWYQGGLDVKLFLEPGTAWEEANRLERYMNLNVRTQEGPVPESHLVNSTQLMTLSKGESRVTYAMRQNQRPAAVQAMCKDTVVLNPGSQMTVEARTSAPVKRGHVFVAIKSGIDGVSCEEGAVDYAYTEDVSETVAVRENLAHDAMVCLTNETEFPIKIGEGELCAEGHALPCWTAEANPNGKLLHTKGSPPEAFVQAMEAKSAVNVMTRAQRKAKEQEEAMANSPLDPKPAIPWTPNFKKAPCGVGKGQRAMTKDKKRPCEVYDKKKGKFLVWFPFTGKTGKYDGSSLRAFDPTKCSRQKVDWDQSEDSEEDPPEERPPADPPPTGKKRNKTKLTLQDATDEAPMARLQPWMLSTLWVGVLCSGIGVSHEGFTMCNNLYHTDFRIAFVLDNDEKALAVHLATFPNIPIIRHTIDANATKTLDAIEKVFPRARWSASYWHGSPSCRKGATCNLLHGDVEEFVRGTKECIAVMIQADPWMWTIEQVPRAINYLDMPNMVIMRMHEKSEMMQHRNRLYISKKPIILPDWEGKRKLLTPREMFAKKHGFKEGQPLILRNSMYCTRDADKLSFTVTGSAMYIGPRNSDLKKLDYDDKQWLMTSTEDFKFPVGMRSREKEQLMAQGIPPSFVCNMCLEIARMRPEDPEVAKKAARATLLKAGEGVWYSGKHLKEKLENENFDQDEYAVAGCNVSAFAVTLPEDEDMPHGDSHQSNREHREWKARRHRHLTKAVDLYERDLLEARLQEAVRQVDPLQIPWSREFADAPLGNRRGERAVFRCKQHGWRPVEVLDLDCPQRVRRAKIRYPLSGEVVEVEARDPGNWAPYDPRVVGTVVAEHFREKSRKALADATANLPSERIRGKVLEGMKTLYRTGPDADLRAACSQEAPLQSFVCEARKGDVPWGPKFAQAPAGVWPGHRAMNLQGEACEVLYPTKMPDEYHVRYPREPSKKGTERVCNLRPWKDSDRDATTRLANPPEDEVDPISDHLYEAEDLPPLEDDERVIADRRCFTTEENEELTDVVQAVVAHSANRWLKKADEVYMDDMYVIPLGMDPLTGKSYPHMKNQTYKNLWEKFKEKFQPVLQKAGEKARPNVTTMELRVNGRVKIHVPSSRATENSIIVAGGYFNGGELECTDWSGRTFKVGIFREAYLCPPGLPRGTAKYTGMRWEVEGYVPAIYEGRDVSLCPFTFERDSETPKPEALGGVSLMSASEERESGPTYTYPWEGAPEKDGLPLPRQPRIPKPNGNWDVKPPTKEELDKALKDTGVTDNPLLTEEEQLLYRKLYSYCWAFFDEHLRFVDAEPVGVQFKDPAQQPIKCQPYRLSPPKMKALEKTIKDWLKDEIIAPGNSPWAFPIVMVPKKNTEDLRVCVDLRRLNKVIVSDSYDAPRNDDALAWLGGKIFRTTLDIRWGYHNIPLTAEAQKILTFTCQLGTYSYARLPFGLVTATSIFQRYMNQVLYKHLWRTAVAVVDDVVIGHSDLKQHMRDTFDIINTLADVGLSAKMTKLQILPKEFKFLGHISTPEGLKPDPGLVEAVQKMAIPGSIPGADPKTQTRALLGLGSYCRKFIKDFAKKVAPLHEVAAANAEFKWTPECQQAETK